MKWSAFVFTVLAAGSCFGQHGGADLELRIEPFVNGEALTLGSAHVLPNGAPITIDRVRMYVSRISGRYEGATVWNDEITAHLVDASQLSTLSIPLSVAAGHRIDTITFLLGIDSATNVSGAMGGDLDPTNGMYWAWNSGYINLKVEGSSPLCSGPKNEFHYHLGGYLPPYQNAQWVHLAVNGPGPIVIRMDLGVFFLNTDLSELSDIMSPSNAAVELARSAVGMFTIVERE